ncbi:MAG TPA: SDR family oxidoreductase [Pyrinomonadaceae bacterium]|nr:SDR family oxidoreductase [Pyrinomonadaceae bacterium]
MTLKDQVCIISGGGSGIGRATAIRMAEDGGKIVLLGRTKSKLQIVQAEIERAGGKVTTHTLDITDLEATQAIVKDVVREFERIDVLVNCAGDISRHRTLLETTVEDIDLTIDSNVKGTIIVTQAVVPQMLATRSGTIINVSSVVGVTPSLISGVAYSAAKAAVINFTHYLNREFVNTGIRACVVLPGEVDTPFLDKRPNPPANDAREMMIAAEDVAEAIALMAGLPQRAMIPELVIRPTLQLRRVPA